MDRPLTAVQNANKGLRTASSPEVGGQPSRTVTFSATTPQEGPAGSGRAQSPGRGSHHRVTVNLWLGGTLTAVLLLLALGAPFFAPYAPDLVDPSARLQSPSAMHWFGTDALGRDLLTRILHGARLAVTGAIVGTGIAATVGVPLGISAGYYGGRVDRWLSRTVEILMGFPPLLLAIIIVARLGPSFTHALLALGIVTIPSFFRIAREGAMRLRCRGYIEAARALGARSGRIMISHLIPNTMPSLLVLTTLKMGRMILAGGGLSFVGLGAQVPKPEWGALLAVGRDYLTTAPWLAVFPGVALTLSVLGLNMLGEGLRDYFDIRAHMPGDDAALDRAA